MEGGIIIGTTPAVVGLISFIFLKEPLLLNKILGILLAVMGIVIFNVTGAAGVEKGLNPLLGNLLVFGAVVGEALFTVFCKVLPDKITPLPASALMTVLGLFLFLPLAVYEALYFDFSAVSLEQWLYIMYSAIVVTVLAYILWFRGVTGVQASTAAVFTGVMPVSAVLLSYLVLGEQLSWAHLLGGLCVVAGVGFITRHKGFIPES